VDLPHSVERWTFVTDGMARQGWLTRSTRGGPVPGHHPAEADRRRDPHRRPGPDLSAIKDELESRGINEQEFSQEGLKITTPSTRSPSGRRWTR